MTLTEADHAEYAKVGKDRGYSPAEFEPYLDPSLRGITDVYDGDRRESLMTPREFFTNPHYTGTVGAYIWPKVLDEIARMNDGSYVEVVATGGIGAAKTSVAICSQLYQLYNLMTFYNPHVPFGLKPTDEIVIVFQSMRFTQAKEVAYDRFKAMVDECPYFTGRFAYDKDIKSQLRFQNHITVKPVAGNEAATIGQNVIGGILDEVNFMESVEKSKKDADGGVYEQAVTLYNSIARRRESRFMTRGQLPGLLCLVSSKRYRGQFTDKKAEEAVTNKRIYVYDKRIWDVVSDAKFEMMYTDEWFEVFVGDEHRKPYMVDKAHPAPKDEQELVMSVPVEHEHDFAADLLKALRDIAGISTTALHPFIMDPARVVESFDCHNSIFSREECDFDILGLKIYPKEFVNPKEPRFIHVDLAISRDSCGFGIGYVTGFEPVRRGPTPIPKEDGTPGKDERPVEMLPRIHIDGLLEIRPPRGGEISFAKIRDIIYLLTKLGLNIQWITFDSFQSTDSKQILNQRGYKTGDASLDKDTYGYEMLKTAFYDGRLDAPPHVKCLRELLRLERDEKKDKVDHRANESKDVADALAGVVYGLTRRMEIWHRFKIPVRDIPQSITQARQDAREEPPPERQGKVLKPGHRQGAFNRVKRDGRKE